MDWFINFTINSWNYKCWGCQLDITAKLLAVGSITNWPSTLRPCNIPAMMQGCYDDLHIYWTRSWVPSLVCGVHGSPCPRWIDPGTSSLVCSVIVGRLGWGGGAVGAQCGNSMLLTLWRWGGALLVQVDDDVAQRRFKTGLAVFD